MPTTDRPQPRNAGLAAFFSFLFPGLGQAYGGAWRMAPLVAGPDIDRVVLSYPQYVDPPTNPRVNYLLIPRRDDVRAEMQRIFGPLLEGWYLGSQADGPPQDST